MRMLPFRYRIVTAGVTDGRVMLQLKMAWARRFSVKFNVNVVLLSTPVSGVFNILPVILVGLAFLLDGCS